MPLRCKDDFGQNIHSFELDEAQWDALRRANTQQRHLRMPCCGEGVVLKTSKLGTRFFAHQRKGDCTTRPESAEHLMLKSIVASTIAQCGWAVATEVRGQTEDGQEWIADVLATRGKAMVAVEIQWSRQSDSNTYARQARYKQSGIRGLWLFRQEVYPQDKDVPAIRVSQSADGSFNVIVPNCEVASCMEDGTIIEYPIYAPRALGVDNFIRAAFEGKLWFGVLRAGQPATASIWGAFIRCWKCKGWTNVVAEVEIKTFLHHESITYSLDKLAEIPDLLDQLPLNDLRRHKVGRIASRYSKTEQGSYLANGCVTCNALQGRFFLQEISHRLTLIAEHQFIVSKNFENYLRHHYDATWRLDLY